MKDWIKLDNAAIIYPATIKRKYATLFRLTITLTENIDKKLLQESLNKVLKRFPTFTYSLRNGFFWCYLEKIKHDAKVEEDSQNPMIRHDFDKDYLFRVRVYKNRIATEFFHALTDGTGATTFLLTLTQEYLHRKYGIKKKYSNFVLNLNDKPTEDETNDAFLKYARSTSGSLEHEKTAWHIKGTKINPKYVNIVTGIMNINDVKKVSKKYNATITEFFVSVMLFNLQKLAGDTKKDIKVSIPINLRNYYETKTLRNFSSYINVGIKNKKYKLEDIIKSVKKQIKELANEKRINEKISGNVKLMENFFIRRIPMFIKKYVMSYAEARMGDGYITTSLSNLGLIDVPSNMKEYITDMNFILGKSRGKSGAAAMIGINDNLYISFSRIIKESEFERLFFTTLSSMGIDILIESNR